MEGKERAYSDAHHEVAKVGKPVEVRPTQLHDLAGFRYFLRIRRQAVTKKAVSGIASTMPRMPLNALPQNTIAVIITTGCRPVCLPMMRGVRNHASMAWTQRKTNKTNPARLQPPPFCIKARGKAVLSPVIVPEYGTILRNPRQIPKIRPNFNPMIVNPVASMMPIVTPIRNWPRKNETTMAINSSTRKIISSRAPWGKNERCLGRERVGSALESRKKKRKMGISANAVKNLMTDRIPPPAAFRVGNEWTRRFLTSPLIPSA